MNITAETLVSDVARENPATLRVFERLGIDYCCGGKVPLKEAIAAKGLQAETILAELQCEEAPGQQAVFARNWATASLTDLCDHIQQTHHERLKQDLPRLEFLTAKVATRHGQHRPELVQIHRLVVGLRAELESHMAKEEQVLFPFCRGLDTAEALPPSHCGTVRNPIEVMVREHEDAGEALAQLRELTNGYTPPPDACNTFRAMYDALHELERDMHEHVHKENNILFPKAIRVEKLLSR